MLAHPPYGAKGNPMRLGLCHTLHTDTASVSTYNAGSFAIQDQLAAEITGTPCRMARAVAAESSLGSSSLFVEKSMCSGLSPHLNRLRLVLDSKSRLRASPAL
jgi:hypothetical protein